MDETAYESGNRIQGTVSVADRKPTFTPKAAEESTTFMRSQASKLQAPEDTGKSLSD